MRTSDIGLWEISTGRRLSTIPGDRMLVDFDPSGTWLLTFDEKSRELIIVEASTGKDVRRVRFPTLARQDANIKLAPSGDRLARIQAGRLYIWDTVADRAVAVHHGTEHSGGINCVAQHSGAGLVASGDSVGTIILRDRADGRFLRMIDTPGAGLAWLAFHPDGRRLASASPPRPDLGAPGERSPVVVSLWDLDRREPLWTYRDGKQAVAIDAAAFALDGSALFVGTTDGRLLRLDVATGQVTQTVELDPSGCRTIAPTPDGRGLLLLDRRGRVQFRAADTLALSREWDAGSDTQAAAFLSAEVIVTGGRAIQLRAADSGRPLMSLEVADGPVRQIATQPGTAQVVFAGQGTEAHRLDLSDLQRQLRALHMEIPGLKP